MYEKGAGLPRRICAFDGDGFLGSREGAKSSVDFAYLAPVLNDRCPATATRSRDHATTLLRAKGHDQASLRGEEPVVPVVAVIQRTATVVAGVKEEEEG
jgi:hypothetical protein